MADTVTRFDDLEFGPHPNWPGGVAARTFFDNGYGVSVIRSQYSYGGDDGLYELAVLRGSADRFEICYDTPITEDVEGHLTEDDVSRLIGDVAALYRP